MSDLERDCKPIRHRDVDVRMLTRDITDKEISWFVTTELSLKSQKVSQKRFFNEKADS